MESEIKKGKQKEVIIKVEDDDDNEAEGVAQMEGATQAEGSTQAGNPSRSTIDPPTLAEMLEKPTAYRRYVSHLEDNPPPAPPDLYAEDFKEWKKHHLLTATLDHLKAVFKDKKKPKEHAWRFYEDFLVVNNKDYRSSPFYSAGSVRTLFDREAVGRAKCKKMADGLTEPERKKREEEGSDETGNKRQRMLE